MLVLADPGKAAPGAKWPPGRAAGIRGGRSVLSPAPACLMGAESWESPYVTPRVCWGPVAALCLGPRSAVHTSASQFLPSIRASQIPYSCSALGLPWDTRRGEPRSPGLGGHEWPGGWRGCGVLAPPCVQQAWAVAAQALRPPRCFLSASSLSGQAQPCCSPGPYCVLLRPPAPLRRDVQGSLALPGAQHPPSPLEPLTVC